MNLLLDFTPDRFDIWPVETEVRGPLGNRLCAGQSGHGFGQVAEGGFRRAAAFLGGLYLQPLFQDCGGVFRQRIAREDVGMATQKFFSQLADHICDGKASIFRCDLAVKDDLEQHIAQLFTQFLRLAVVQGVEQLIGFFEQARFERDMGLCFIPRAAVGAAQLRHYVEQFTELLLGFLVTHDFTSSADATFLRARQRDRSYVPRVLKSRRSVGSRNAKCCHRWN